jgi:hypothetical protein
MGPTIPAPNQAPPDYADTCPYMRVTFGLDLRLSKFAPRPEPPSWRTRYLRACSAFMRAERGGNTATIARAKRRLRALLREAMSDGG